MPYKFHESRRHKFPKARYRVTNWPEYDAALVRRGSLTLWFTEEAVAAWRAPATGVRGGQPIYWATAIETGLTLRLVPPAAASNRRPAAIDRQFARARYCYPRSHDAEPPG